ncbi:hypothetical protein FisN_13Lu112 [Fistulifera solaris]|uniref:Uncharacterized protein n=1 Tax=Fistulifera solaris TaxID=1519565 RepID=A0A1Z5JF37_FISSO|nr:hypothetical protein FisN_13Lu112 [Fistulifera solaris]|eukprot:GAX12627.1 hypothetical protein FisN_13Lu112 [Fistulifera solaris]
MTICWDLIRRMEKGALLERIPEEEWSPEQAAWGTEEPLYRFRYTPTLDDFQWDDKQQFAVWRENGTLVCLQHIDGWRTELFEGWRTRDASSEPRYKYQGQSVAFEIDFTRRVDGVKCTIYGKTNHAIAETLTFLWSLDRGRAKIQKALLSSLDVSILSAEQLASILNANRNIQLNMPSIAWTPEQSVVLATRPFSLNWNLTQRFSDHGTAFVSALQTRQKGQSNFGTLTFEVSTFSRPNLELLFQLEDTFTKLDVECHDHDLVLLPFSAKVETLHYTFETYGIVDPEDFGSIEMKPKNVHLEIKNFIRNVLMVTAVLDRLAQLGHLERLGLTLAEIGRNIDADQVALVAEALLRVIHANPSLSYLDLSKTHRFHQRVDWTPHYEQIFDAMEARSSLSTSTIAIHEPGRNTPFGGYSDTSMNAALYSQVETLLSRNRHILVEDQWGLTFTDGSKIDSIYKLNRFYNGSENLAKGTTSFWKPQLMVTALTHSSSGKFSFTALLLSHHTNTLVECLYGS